MGFYKFFTNCAALNTRDKNRRLIGADGENIFLQCGTALRPQYAIACMFICEKARDLHCNTFQKFVSEILRCQATQNASFTHVESAYSEKAYAFYYIFSVTKGEIQIRACF